MKSPGKTPTKIVKKTVPQPGQYVYRPLKCAVLSCACGDKYIKTRKNQTRCLRCIIEEEKNPPRVATKAGRR